MKTKFSKIVPIKREDSDITDEVSKEEDTKLVSAPKFEINAKQDDPARQVADSSVWWYYAKSIGAWRVIAAITIIVINVASSNLPSE
jgi:hypothetical protein